MKTSWQLLSPLLLLTLTSVALAADETPPSTPLPTTLEERLHLDARLLQDHDGDLVLAINRPWKSFSRPSVEVCLLPDDLPETVNVRPLCFVNGYLKGKVTVDLYHSLDQADDVPVRLPFTANDIQFEMLGNRNSLGKAAVCVACRTEEPAKTSPEEKRTLARAVFCLLDYWAVERENLYLDLPADYFATPGKLRIWLLRDTHVVWSDTIRWPGIAGRQSPATVAPAKDAAEAKPKAKKDE